MIANPPWVFTREGDFQEEIKKLIYIKYLKHLRGCQQGRAKQSGKINLYAIFILQSLFILKKDGHLTYILPNTILRATVYDVIRKFILDNSLILKIVDLSSGVFENVTASTILLFLKKSNVIKPEHMLIVLDGISQDSIKYKGTISQIKFVKNVSYVFNIYSDKGVDKLIDKIRNEGDRLDNYFEVFAGGIATGPGKKKYISNKPLNELYKPLIEGKDIKAYKVDFKHKYILYNRDKLYRAREESIFLYPEKIITQRVGGGIKPLVVGYDNQQYYTFNSTNSILPKEDTPLSLKYLMSILNSNLMNWYYTIQFTNKSDLTVNISKTYLEQLPIVKMSNSDQKSFIDLVDRILVITKDEDYLKNRDKQARVKVLKGEIDQMVYKLYGLTNEEIVIVEGSQSK